MDTMRIVNKASAQVLYVRNLLHKHIKTASLLLTILIRGICKQCSPGQS